MKLQLRSPDKIIFEKDEVLSFSATLLDQRRLTILPGHAPLLAVLPEGTATIKDAKAKEVIQIGESILKFRDDQIILYVLADLVPEKDE
jgi:F0F1-type ATP synthase epsilon subunit